MKEDRKTPRLHLIDTIRGITIISMVFFHFAWDLVYLYGIPIPWLHENPGYYWQQSICWSFIFIAGFCWSFGRQPLKRGLLVFFWGLVVMAVTCIFLPEDRIIFGVLTLLGSAMIITTLLQPVMKRLPAGLGAVLSFILFLFFKQVNDHFIGFGGLRIPLPAALYKDYFTTYLGFPMPHFFSTDYFSILPWIFLFFTGYYVYRLYKKKIDLGNASFCSFLQWKEPVFSSIGRHSLLIYLLHQPILYGIYLIWVYLK